MASPFESVQVFSATGRCYNPGKSAMQAQAHFPPSTDRTMDYTALDLLRQNHPAWRLLRSEHAPLLASFLQRVFIAPNVRTISQAELPEALEDELYGLREQLGAHAFPRSGADYLNDWAAHDKGWLRKARTHRAVKWQQGLLLVSLAGTQAG
jgi:hypothetical protein